MNEITVTNQTELDAIPLDYHGRIYVKFGTPSNPAILRHAWGNASAELWENASAELWGNASAELWENASAVLRGNASAVLRGNASAVLRGNASAVLRENASAVLRGNASAELWENASAELWENAQAVDRSIGHNVSVHGNARIVHDPKTLDEYIRHYEIEEPDGKLKLYKAVHKRGEEYFSNYDDAFEYKIGRAIYPDRFDDEAVACSHGIHVAHLHWALGFGRNWQDLAILELEIEKADIVYPKDTDGKLRARKAFVVREVPKSEWGLYGEILFGKDTK